MDTKILTTENLRKLIDETESTLEELKTELEQREETARHAEIDKLETHLQSAELSLQTIRDFISQLLKDVRGA